MFSPLQKGLLLLLIPGLLATPACDDSAATGQPQDAGQSAVAAPPEEAKPQDGSGAAGEDRGDTAGRPANAPAPSDAVEVQWYNGIPLMSFRPLWRTIDRVQRIHIGPKPDELSRVIDVVGREEQQRVDPNFLRNAKPDNFNEISIPWDTEQLYLQLEYTDGSKGPVQSVALQNEERAPMVWLTASDGAEAPRVFATWNSEGLRLLPFAPNGTRQVLAAFQGQSFEPIDLHPERGFAGVLIDEVATWVNGSDLRLLYQMKDGSEIGPFTYDMRALEPMVRGEAARMVRLDRRTMLQCQRLPVDPFAPSVRVFAAEDTREVREHWLGVREVRIGASPENLNKRLAVDVKLDSFIGRRSTADQRPGGFVRLPGETEAAYAQFVLYDGTALDPIRLEVAGGQ